MKCSVHYVVHNVTCTLFHYSHIIYDEKIENHTQSPRLHVDFIGKNLVIIGNNSYKTAKYSKTSLSRQTRLSPHEHQGQISRRVFYLDKSPLVPLTLATTWTSLTPRNLTSVCRHPRLVSGDLESSMCVNGHVVRTA